MNKQCLAKTHQGTQCTRTVTSKTSVLCTLHLKVPCIRRMLMSDPEPWEALQLKPATCHYVKHSNASVHKTLRYVCWKGPSHKDKPGHVYVYERNRDGYLPYYKIGRTRRSVTERLKEWEGAHLLKSFRVSHHKFAERMLFLLLESVRLKRYWNALHRTYVNVWYNSSKPVTSQDATRIELGWTERTEDVACHVEWFALHESEFDLYALLADVVKLVNNWSKRHYNAFSLLQRRSYSTSALSESSK